jgi:hypothetical protein
MRNVAPGRVERVCAPPGQPAVIEAAFYGTQGGAALHNVNGSFYDFTLARFTGTNREVLAAPPHEWGGRAAVDWLRHLAGDRRFDPEAEHFIEVAQMLDAVNCR